MTKEEAKLRSEIIDFLRSNEQIRAWWIDRERKYMMDVPMMLVGEIEHLLNNFNQPTKWKQANLKQNEQLFCDACGKEKEEGLDHCKCYEGKEWVKKSK